MDGNTCLCPVGSNARSCTGNCVALQRVCLAVFASEVLEFDYAGYSRSVEPHYYGLNSRNNQTLRAYQTNWGGETPEPGWHVFLIEKMTNLATSHRRFTGVRPGYNPDDKGMRGYFARR